MPTIHYSRPVACPVCHQYGAILHLYDDYIEEQSTPIGHRREIACRNGCQATTEQLLDL